MVVVLETGLHGRIPPRAGPREPIEFVIKSKSHTPSSLKPMLAVARITDLVSLQTNQIPPHHDAKKIVIRVQITNTQRPKISVPTNGHHPSEPT